MLRVISLCLVVLVGGGCATAPVPRTIENSFHFDKTYDDVWTAVIETMAELNLPLSNVAKDSGLITTDWINFGYSGNYCDCGSPGICTDGERTGKFNIFVKTIPTGGVDIKVNTTFQVMRSFSNNTSTVSCLSTGALEAQIRDVVSKKLAVG
jgi:hypothetical protein